MFLLNSHRQDGFENKRSGNSQERFFNAQVAKSEWRGLVVDRRFLGILVEEGSNNVEQHIRESDGIAAHDFRDEMAEEVPPMVRLVRFFSLVGPSAKELKGMKGQSSVTRVGRRVSGHNDSGYGIAADSKGR